MRRKHIRRSAMFGLALLVCCSAVPLFAQGGKPPRKPVPAPDVPSGKSASAPLLDVGREKYTVGQIADAYKRNANRGGKSFYSLSADSATEFLNLFANYRLKVQAALDAGVDKRPEVVEDLRKNRIDLAVPAAPNSGYLIERKVVDPAVERIFKRRDDELLLALIYVAMRPADPADTLRAYQKAIRLFQSVHAGADFAAIARDSSDDPSTREGGGRLPSYVTAGMILPSIEDAAYETKSGQVYPGLVRVPAGFVIVKVLDRSTRYKVRAAHILVAVPPNSDSSISDASRRKAEDALARIRKGEDFAKVAKEVSDDKVSGENGGDFLVYYTRSLGFEAKNAKLEPAIEESLYRLKDGEVSNIIKTQYGYHIVKRLESRKPTFEEEKETIRQFYKQRLLAEDRAQFVRSVVDKHGMRVNEDILGQMLAAMNQNATTADTGWAGGIGRGLRGETLYNYGGASYTVGSWIDTIKARPELHSLALSRASVRNSFYTLHEQEAMTDEAKNLETEYPEFATLMQEFRDGILIFNLEDEMVWKRLNQGYDDAKGKAYFEKHRSKYMTPAKLGLTEILVYKEDEAKKLYEQGKSGSVPFDTLAARNTQRQGYRERAGHWEPAIAKNADLVKQVLDRQPNPKAGDILEPFSYQGGYSIIRVNSVEPAREMTYDEAKTEVQGDYVEDYQKQLQKEWLDTLRLKYHVKINDQTLRAALAAK